MIGLEGIRVFVVEDESLVAMVVEDMLRELGCEVVTSATSVTEALDRVQAGGFEVALLDLNLQGQTVFPVAEALSRQAIPFAFASGYGAGGVPDEFQAWPVIGKPFQIEELSAGISIALARNV